MSATPLALLPGLLPRPPDHAPKRRAVSKKKAAAPPASPPASPTPPPADEPEEKKRKLEEKLNKSGSDQLPAQVPADVECPLAEKGWSVYIDRENRIIYDAMLNQTNLGDKNNNKFFLLQVLQPPNSVRRVRCVVPLGSCRFYEKTKNNFDDRENFEKKPKKYDLIQMDYSVDEEKPEEEGEKPAEKPESALELPCKLEPRVKEAVDLICDMSAMVRQLQSLNFDPQKTPLGKITRAQIKSGYEILTQIERAMQEGRHHELADLTAAYYTKVPHNFGMKKAPVLSNMVMLKTELELLETLLEVETAVAKLSEKTEEKLHPSDKNYQRLGCAFTPLEKSHKTYKLIEQYLENTHGATHHLNLKLRNVFEIDRDGEADGFRADPAEPPPAVARLASHVDPEVSVNEPKLISGILNQGLRIAPPEAPCSSCQVSMFGKGVYFANCVSKSANYCQAHNTRSFMLLSQVALGQCRPLKDADFEASNLPDGFHSTHGVGRQYPNEKESKKLKLDKKDVVVPAGKLVQRDDEEVYLEYDEFIVYDTNQIRLRYLLEIDFN
ncbi:Poly [ADP-ribose] polymerase [Aphelenchoides fujianensis]|nr:Poly [ADP-ribose] polymerase [Aphelenchoides fujianensis]